MCFSFVWIEILPHCAFVLRCIWAIIVPIAIKDLCFSIEWIFIQNLIKHIFIYLDHVQSNLTHIMISFYHILQILYMIYIGLLLKASYVWHETSGITRWNYYIAIMKKLIANSKVNLKKIFKITWFRLDFDFKNS